MLISSLIQRYFVCLYLKVIDLLNGADKRSTLLSHVSCPSDVFVYLFTAERLQLNLVHHHLTGYWRNAHRSVRVRRWCEMRLELARPSQFGEGCGVLAKSTEVRGNWRGRALRRCPQRACAAIRPGPDSLARR